MQASTTHAAIAFLSADLSDSGAGGAWCDRAIWEGLSQHYAVNVIQPYARGRLGWVRNATLRAVLQNIRLLRATRGASAVLVDSVYARETFLAMWYWRHVLRQPIFGLMYHLRHHLTERPLVRRFERQAEGAFLRALTRVFVLSQSGSAECVALGVPTARIVTIPVVARMLEPGVPSVRPPAMETITFLFVGTVQRRKGLDAGLRALGRHGGTKKVRLLVVGRPPDDPAYAQELHQLAEQCAPVTIEWWGHVSDARLAEAYRQADAFLFPSRWEGYGMAIEEAMQAGLPIVCFNAGSVGELVRDGHSGWVAEVDAEDDLAAAIGECVEDREERLRRGRNAAAAARQRLQDRPPIWRPILESLTGLGIR